jgi:hypothetical protein
MCVCVCVCARAQICVHMCVCTPICICVSRCLDSLNIPQTTHGPFCSKATIHMRKEPSSLLLRFSPLSLVGQLRSVFPRHMTGWHSFRAVSPSGSCKCLHHLKQDTETEQLGLHWILVCPGHELSLFLACRETGRKKPGSNTWHSSKALLIKQLTPRPSPVPHSPEMRPWTIKRWCPGAIATPRLLLFRGSTV